MHSFEIALIENISFLHRIYASPSPIYQSKTPVEGFYLKQYFITIAPQIGCRQRNYDCRQKNCGWSKKIGGNFTELCELSGTPATPTVHSHLWEDFNLKDRLLE